MEVRIFGVSSREPGLYRNRASTVPERHCPAVARSMGCECSLRHRIADMAHGWATWLWFLGLCVLGIGSAHGSDIFDLVRADDVESLRRRLTKDSDLLNKKEPGEPPPFAMCCLCTLALMPPLAPYLSAGNVCEQDLDLNPPPPPQRPTSPQPSAAFCKFPWKLQWRSCDNRLGIPPPPRPTPARTRRVHLDAPGHAAYAYQDVRVWSAL